MIDSPTLSHREAPSAETLAASKKMADDSLTKEAAAARHTQGMAAVGKTHAEEIQASIAAADIVRGQLEGMQILPPSNKATLVGKNADIRVHMHPGLVDRTKRAEPVLEKKPEAT